LKQAIGLFQLRALVPGFEIAEWGFALGAPFWATGIFEEAAVLVADFAFKTVGVHRLEARAVTLNGRGNGALQKLGARGEAILRRAFDREQTQFLWAILSEEWAPPKLAARPPFDAVRMKQQIQRAITQQTRYVPATRLRASSPRPHPFFLTDPSDDPSDDPPRES
jgi:hypothetical protein